MTKAEIDVDKLTKALKVLMDAYEGRRERNESQLEHALRKRYNYLNKIPVLLKEPIEFVPFKKAQTQFCDICGEEETHTFTDCLKIRLHTMKMIALENDFLQLAKSIAKFEGEITSS